MNATGCKFVDFEGTRGSPTPEDIVEVITYGMVEGGFMPAHTGEKYIDAARAGTRECLGKMALPDSPHDEWERKMFAAMRMDAPLVSALVYEVFRAGWRRSVGDALGCTHPELLEDMPQGCAADRIRLYIDRFNPWALGEAAFYRDQLDVIPSAVVDGIVTWRIYHVQSGSTVETGYMSRPSACAAIAKYPPHPDAMTPRDRLAGIIDRYASADGTVIQADPATLADIIAEKMGLEGGAE